jgi:hypothetical protein
MDPRQKLEGDAMRGTLLDRAGHERAWCERVTGWESPLALRGASVPASSSSSSSFTAPLADPAPFSSPARRGVRGAQVRRRGPGPSRPAVEPLRHRGTGVTMTRARGTGHPNPVSAATTVALALLAALITAWLGLVAQFSNAAPDASTPSPERLGVVRVESGETLQRLAVRVAPGAPVSQVVEQIRVLNKLDSVAVQAGRTLIAPVG